VLNCQDVLEALSDLVDDRIADDIRRRLEAHLAGCRTCTVLLDSTRKTLKIVTDTGALDLPEQVSERLIDKVMTRVRGR
jgi:anti-sigma factor RsiW